MFSPPAGSEVIHAAGGLLWRSTPRGREILLIHRKRYGPEWALPKGKLDAGESWTQAALREVEEETGCRATIGDFAGGNIYKVDGVPKVVLYWNMTLVAEGEVADTREVVAKRWVSVSEALTLMTHTSERAMMPRGAGFTA